MLHRYPIQKFHGDECLAILLANVVDSAYVGVIQCRRGLGFALKTSKSLRIASNCLWQEFESNEAMQPRVLGLIHHSHAATAEFFDDLVVRDGLSNHQKTRGFRVCSSY